MVADQLIELTTEMVDALRGDSKCSASVLEHEPAYMESLEDAVKRLHDAQRQQ